MLSSFGTSSITKLANTYVFELVRGLYSISYSLSSIAHFTNLPDWLGLWSTVHRGCDVMTVLNATENKVLIFEPRLLLLALASPSRSTWFRRLPTIYLYSISVFVLCFLRELALRSQIVRSLPHTKGGSLLWLVLTERAVR